MRLEDQAPSGRAVSDKGGEEALVCRLSQAMRRKLAENRGKLHWRDDAVEASYLLGRLVEEVDELRRSVGSGLSSIHVWREAADVANFAAMVADWYEGSGRGEA